MQSLITSPPSDTHFSIGSQILRDYTLSYTKLELSFSDRFRFIFPRIGYLMFNLITGDEYSCTFLNYNLSKSTPNHLYITGLLSGGSLTTVQKGMGGGFAAKIHPVIGYYLFKIPMYKLTDRQVRISHILDHTGHLLRNLEENELLLSLDNPHLLNFFGPLLPDKSLVLNDPIYHAVNTIIHRRGIIEVRKLAAQFFMSERTLHRQFLLKVGLSPQAYAKIWQLRNAMQLLQENPGARLNDIAFEAGYYDVAHLAHDFKNRVAIPPSQFYQDIHPMTQSYLQFPESLR